MVQHISSDGYSMVVTTPKHKGDQEGNNFYPKQTKNPFICSILSLAILVIGVEGNVSERSTSCLQEPSQRFDLARGCRKQTNHWSVESIRKILSNASSSKIQEYSAVKKI